MSALLWLGYTVLLPLPEAVALRRTCVLEDGLTLPLSGRVLPLQPQSLQHVDDVLRQAEAFGRFPCIKTATRRLQRLAQRASVRRFTWMDLRTGGLLQLHALKGYQAASRLATAVGLSLPSELRRVPVDEPLVLASGRTVITGGGIRLSHGGGRDDVAGKARAG